MGRTWAMGCTASNAASDLADRAATQAAMRETFLRNENDAQLREIQRQGERAGLSQEEIDRHCQAAYLSDQQIRDQLRQARGTLAAKHQHSSPSAEEWGAPVPMHVRGEVYQTVEVERRSDGSQVHTGVAWNGPLMKTVKVRMEPDGGDYTRVAAEAR